LDDTRLTNYLIFKEQKIKRPESFDPGLLKLLADSRDLWRTSRGHFDRAGRFCIRHEMESAYHRSLIVTVLEL